MPKSQAMRIMDRYMDEWDWLTLMENARMAAMSAREEEFIASSLGKHKKWGVKMFWSDAQDNWARKIAEGS